MPDASQNGKLEMASGKLRGFADYKCEMQSVDAGCRLLRKMANGKWQVANQGASPIINAKCKV